MRAREGRRHRCAKDALSLRDVLQLAEKAVAAFGDLAREVVERIGLDGLTRRRGTPAPSAPQVVGLERSTIDANRELNVPGNLRETERTRTIQRVLVGFFFAAPSRRWLRPEILFAISSFRADSARRGGQMKTIAIHLRGMITDLL
jgi:hypothetical protein